MNYFTSTKSNPLIIDIVLLVTRIFVGFAMLSHGYPKLQDLLSGEEIQFFSFLGLSDKTSLILAVFAEFVCSIFIILGLFTRFAVFFLIITMAVAGLIVHSGDPFQKREASLLYLSVYLMLFAFGPGKYSVDAMIGRKREPGW
ncbi:DoxX family protein [Kaistella faecalis]|uniref:DoxX family protein n=1 Tax=Kaistella faecalis TaxID=2852098 RepID=UPI001B7428D4|nr:DoxX family protein [Chryseobacterium faecale]MBP6377830.1 DoxX family protein [Kaistella sp.]UFK97926.1 DoxX family protein [Chryseobacterium faecale]